MPDSVTVGVKSTAAAGTAVAGTAGAVEIIRHTERVILGVPQSVLMAAIVGALIGVLLLRDRDTAAVAPPLQGAWYRRGASLVVRAGSLGAFVLAYAVLAAWIVTAMGTWFPGLVGPAQLPFAGISGVLIKRMLPKYLQVVERWTEWIGGKAGAT